MQTSERETGFNTRDAGHFKRGQAVIHGEFLEIGLQGEPTVRMVVWPKIFADKQEQVALLDSRPLLNHLGNGFFVGLNFLVGRWLASPGSGGRRQQ